MDLAIEDGLWWFASLKLASWTGYQRCRGSCHTVDSTAPPDGVIKLVFAPEGRGTDPLNAAELSLIAWFERHEPEVSEAVKATILKWCAPNCAERLQEFDFDDTFPKVTTPEDLKPLIELHTIYIHQNDGGGIPYVGYELECEWEVEHGLGVLMHGTRPVHVGFADTSMHLWMAEQDAERRAGRRL